MNLNLRALGLALLAMFTFGAVAASSAFAVDHFTAEKEKAVITSTVSENFVTTLTNEKGETAQKVACKTSKFSGTFVTSATTVTVFPTYKGTINKEVDENHCTTTGGKIEVELNGCDYDLTGETTKEDKKAVGKDAVFSITCPKEKEITYKTNLGCTLHIPEQTPTEGGVVYTNITHLGKKAIEVTATVTGITYTSTGALCGAAGIPSEGNNTDLTATMILTCYEDLGNGIPDEFKEGAQIGCEVS